MSDRTTPPGLTSVVRCRHALVLAPHFDDETIGCGGLIAGMARSGARVSVLYLSDSAATDGDEAARRTYTERRRAEAACAARVLGIEHSEELGAPDGDLLAHLPALASGVAWAIARLQPDLVLVPGPTEISADHRAAFRALHEALTGVRDADSLYAATRDLTILTYEVNHPGHPDLLVEVSAELPRIEEAMRCYDSQLQRHGYLAAALGMRQFRTLTLSPSVAGAEGYRRLALDDFRTFSLAALEQRLGAVPLAAPAPAADRVSVIVRTRERPQLVREALRSIADSTYRNVEVVLVNDGGLPPEVPGEYPFPLRAIELRPGRGRAAAAQAGLEAASGRWLTFLDDDDLMFPDHLMTLLEVATARGAPVVYTDAAVASYERDATGAWTCRERSLPYSRDFDRDVLLVDNYIPINTLLIERAVAMQASPFDESLPAFEDWDFLIRLADLADFVHVRKVTCEYRHFVDGDQVFGANPVAMPDFATLKERVLRKHAARLQPDRLTRAVTTLRAEAAGHATAARAAAPRPPVPPPAVTEFESSAPPAEPRRPPARIAAAGRGALLRELVRRGLEVRYRGSVAGVAWTLLDPAWQLALLAFVFGQLLRISPQGEATDSFAAFLIAGLLPWMAFRQGLSRAVTAVVDNARLVRGHKADAGVFVLAVVVEELVHAGVAMAMLIAVLMVTGELAVTALPWLPLAVLLQVALTSGLALALATAQVFFRDVRRIVDLALNAVFYLTPIVYPLALVPESLRPAITLNPLTGLVGLFRAALFGGPPPSAALLVTVAWAAVALVAGIWLQQRFAPQFADEI